MQKNTIFSEKRGREFVELGKIEDILPVQLGEEIFLGAAWFSFNRQGRREREYVVKALRLAVYEDLLNLFVEVARMY